MIRSRVSVQTPNGVVRAVIVVAPRTKRIDVFDSNGNIITSISHWDQYDYLLASTNGE